MFQCLEADPDQTAKQLLIDFRARYPDRCHDRHLRTLQRRLKIWRREAVQRLICEMRGITKNVEPDRT
jgi:hypothetical protein